VKLTKKIDWKDLYFAIIILGLSALEICLN
jgi:hypothetical protein